MKTADLKKILKTLFAAGSKTNNGIIYINPEKGYVAIEDSELYIEVGHDDLKNIANKELLLDGKKLGSVLNSAGKEITIAVHSSESRVIISSNKSVFELMLMNESNKPLTVINTPIKISSYPLVEYSKLLSYSASPSEDNEKFAFCGAVQVKHTGISDNLKTFMIGTDGRRIAISDTNNLSFLGEDVYLPHRISRLIPEMLGGALYMWQDDSTIYCQSEQFLNFRLTIAAKKYTQSFPDLLSYVPKEVNMEVICNAEEMKNALRAVQTMADPETQRVELFFNGEDMALSTHSEEGLATDYVTTSIAGADVDPLDEVKPIKIALNCRYLLEFFEKVQGVVVIRLKDNKSPIHLLAGNFSYILAPLNF